jgi:predicted esterase
MNAKTTQ